MYKRVLFIAPADSGLNIMPEIDTMYDLGYSVQSVQGDVSRARLFEVVRRQKFGIIHFACHAGPEGVLLSKGELLDAAAIVQFAKACGAILVFLNACETAEIGQMLVDEDIPAVICALRRIDDQMARETAQVFYKALAQRNDVRMAYHDSRPPIKGAYCLFTDGLLEQVEFGPVIERLTQLENAVRESNGQMTAIVAANNTEHAQFRTAIAQAVDNCGDMARQRQWFLRVSVGVIVIGFMLSLVITFIGKGG